MEDLKHLNDICQPDERLQCMMLMDERSGAIRPLSLKDLHDVAQEIKLHQGVPERIRSHFETARNLFVYSYFYYPFNVAAQLHAFLTTEFALRESAGGSKSGFRQLLREAVAEGWISDKGFSGFAPWN